MKALVGTFNQEKGLVGTFSVIVKLRVIFAKVRFKLHSGSIKSIIIMPVQGSHPPPHQLGDPAPRPRVATARGATAQVLPSLSTVLLLPGDYGILQDAPLSLRKQRKLLLLTVSLSNVKRIFDTRSVPKQVVST